MWLKDEVDDSILEEVNRRLREYIITQMSYFLRFMLAENEIEDSRTKTFDEVCDDERNELIQRYDSPKYIPNFNCLWDIIYNLWDIDTAKSYTPILSAYCRSNKIATKNDLYIKMSAKLESWIRTINRIEDIVIIAIGMSRNHDICYTLNIYDRNYNNEYSITKFYKDSLDILIKNNFENIDPDLLSFGYGIRPIKPVQNKYDDPLQQVFYKYIMRRFRQIQPDLTVNMTPGEICELLSEIIHFRFRINISLNIPIIDKNIRFNNIDQIVDYFESKIPQYPTKLKDHLAILLSIGRLGYTSNDSLIANLAKMAELSKYNLRNLPIDLIINGYSGATPLDEIPLEDIPEYYARLTHNYSGTHTKAARR